MIDLWIFLAIYVSGIAVFGYVGLFHTRYSRLFVVAVSLLWLPLSVAAWFYTTWRKVR